MFRPLALAAALAPMSLADAPIIDSLRPEFLPSVLEDPRLHHKLGFSRRVSIDSTEVSPRGDLPISGSFKYMSVWNLSDNKSAIVGTLSDGNNALPAVFVVNKNDPLAQDFKQNVYVLGNFDLCHLDPVLRPFLPDSLLKAFKGHDFFLASTPSLTNTPIATILSEPK